MHYHIEKHLYYKKRRIKKKTTTKYASVVFIQK